MTQDVTTGQWGWNTDIPDTKTQPLFTLSSLWLGGWGPRWGRRHRMMRTVPLSDTHEGHGHDHKDQQQSHSQSYDDATEHLRHI